MSQCIDVFISSTARDLPIHRKDAMDALWGSFTSSALGSSLAFERMSNVTPTGAAGSETLLQVLFKSSYCRLHVVLH